MALFGNDDNQEEKERQFIQETLEEHNVFEGIPCDLVLPEKQLKASGKSGAKKGLATLAFGFVGYAATSATSQNEENREVKTILQIVENGIVFKNANIDGSDMRIPYGEIVKMVVIEDDKGKNEFIGIITLLKNKQIILTIDIVRFKVRQVLINHICNILNERAFGIKNEEPGWGLDSEYQGNKLSYDGSDISNLERISVMYEKGLLDEDEFKKLKKGIIEK